MKSRLLPLLGSFVFSANVLISPLHGQTPSDLEVLRLSDHALIVREQGPQPTNLIALDTEKGIVVIDAGISAAVAEVARERIAEAFGRTDFAYLVNTHDHGDHTYGNAAFADISIVGHALVPERMEANEDQRLRTLDQLGGASVSLRHRLEQLDPGSEEAKRIEGTLARYEALASNLGDDFRLTPPAITFRDTMTLDLGDRTLELSHFGKSHSDTDILVLCREEGLLATGDLAAPGHDPYLDSERVQFLPRWLENLNWALADEQGVNMVIPAHGEPIPSEELARIRDFVITQQESLGGKKSAFFRFKDTFEERGLEASLGAIDELSSQPEGFYFFHAEFDSFVFRLMMEENLKAAIPLFEKLALLFPGIPNAYDSLGEAYLRADRSEDAAEAFERCLEIDPEHANARRRLAEIRG